MAFPAQPIDSKGVPISSVYVHNGGFTAVQGSTTTDTDSSSNVSTPANINITQVGSTAVSALPVSMADTFGNATNITAATTFSGVPTISQLVANSSVLLANPGDQSTFLVAIEVASAFNGTLSFYGLEPDSASLQLISAHQRGASTIGSSTAINTGAALNQVWAGNCAGFKAVYVVCTTFTSGTASVQLGLSAANYAVSITNTASSNVAQINGTTTDTNSGNKSAGTQRVVLATDQPALTNALTVTANAGTNLNTSTLALESGGHLASLDGHVPANIINVGTPTQTAVSVGATSTSVLSSNASAKFRAFVNDSVYVIYLSLNGAAALNTGIRLNANGGSLLFDRYVPTGAVTAICATAGANLLAVEG